MLKEHGPAAAPAATHRCRDSPARWRRAAPGPEAPRAGRPPWSVGADERLRRRCTAGPKPPTSPPTSPPISPPTSSPSAVQVGDPDPDPNPNPNPNQVGDDARRGHRRDETQGRANQEDEP